MPILLGELLRAAHVPQAERLYGIVVVVVVFSVLVQGGLVPAVADRLRLQMHTQAPEPWALGVRLRDEPEGVHRLRVRPGSTADGCTIGRLTDELGDAWISIVVRDSTLVPVRADTMLRAGDDVVVLGDHRQADAFSAAFGRTG